MGESSEVNLALVATPGSPRSALERSVTDQMDFGWAHSGVLGSLAESLSH